MLTKTFPPERSQSRVRETAIALFGLGALGTFEGYWGAFSNPDEAHYVTAIFNSDVPNQAIKPFQSTGLLGERDIEKKLLELPIPLFDHENALHRKLSEMGVIARAAAAEAIKTGDFPSGGALARQRGFVRTRLKKELKEIDALVAKLLSK